MAVREQGDELLFMDWTLNVPYRWAAGIYVGRFLKGLRDEEKIYANDCPNCGRYLLPPRVVCGRCHVRMGDDYTEVGPQGTVLAFAVCEQSFIDPSTGLPRQVPYSSASILMDGAPVTFTHFLEECDPERLSVGMRVEAVFKAPNQRDGLVTDILHFKTVKEGN
jgi:uncharacterized protein